jgi:hypothetical protein
MTSEGPSFFLRPPLASAPPAPWVQTCGEKGGGSLLPSLYTTPSIKGIGGRGKESPLDERKAKG